MSESSSRKSGQPVALLIGILLTILAVVAHRFLPERRLTLDSARAGATFFLMQFGDGASAQSQWVDQANFHFTCGFAKAGADQDCSFTYLLYATNADRGIDLS